MQAVLNAKPEKTGGKPELRIVHDRPGENLLAQSKIGPVPDAEDEKVTFPEVKFPFKAPYLSPNDTNRPPTDAETELLIRALPKAIETARDKGYGKLSVVSLDTRTTHFKITSLGKALKSMIFVGLSPQDRVDLNNPNYEKIWDTIVSLGYSPKILETRTSPEITISLRKMRVNSPQTGELTVPLAESD